MDLFELKKPPTVLVVGARTGIGLEAVHLSLQEGYRVRAFSRHAHEIDIEDPRLEKIPGDAMAPADVSAAVQGVDAVIVSLGVPANLKLLTGPIQLFSEASTVIIHAMQQAGVKRLLAVTGFGAGESHASIAAWQRPMFNLVFGKAYQDKTRQEALIMNSGLNWTIARPGVLTNGPIGDYHVLAPADAWRNGMVSRSSVADFLIRQVACDSMAGYAPVIVN